jgi:hypothetical protein
MAHRMDGEDKDRESKCEFHLGFLKGSEFLRVYANDFDETNRGRLGCRKMGGRAKVRALVISDFFEQSYGGNGVLTRGRTGRFFKIPRDTLRGSSK